MNKIQEGLQYAHDSSPGWQERFAAASLKPIDISTPEELAKLPVLRKEELPQLQRSAAPFAKLTAVPLRQVSRIFLSPGPIYEPQGDDDDYWGFAAALEAAGFGPGDLVLNTFSYHLSPAGFMFDSALRKLGCTVIPAGTGSVEQQLQMMQQLPVNGYVGLPSYLIKLLSEGDERGYAHIAPAKAFFTAEAITVPMQHYLQEKEIRYTEGYGTAELGCVAYADGGDGMKVCDELVVQICHPETGELLPHGEIGELVVTRLNRTYPLIRFGTGDLSAQKAPGRIAGVLGRTNDAVKVKGMFVHFQQLRTCLQRKTGVSYFQAVVTNEQLQDVLTLYVEVDELDAAGLTDAVKETIRVTPRIIHVPHGTIDRDEKQFLDKRPAYTEVK